MNLIHTVRKAVPPARAARILPFLLALVAFALLANCGKPAPVVAPALVPESSVPFDGSIKTQAKAVSLSIQNNDWALLDTLLGPDFTYTGDGYRFTRDEYIGFMQDMKIAFADMKMEFTHVLVDGEFVTINFISRSKNVGKFMGAPATGKNLEVHGTLIRQIRGGKAIQEWQTTDLLGVMTQMGFGALQGYALAVGLFHADSPRPVRKPWAQAAN